MSASDALLLVLSISSACISTWEVVHAWREAKRMKREQRAVVARVRLRRLIWTVYTLKIAGNDAIQSAYTAVIRRSVLVLLQLGARR